MEIEQAQKRLWASGDGGLILLIGSSPLPNLIAAAALKPPGLALICSPDTERGVGRLLRVLRGSYEPAIKKFGPSDHLTLRDPYRAASVREDLEPHTRDLSRFALLYTGGTKIMAVHVYQVWAEAGGAPEHACYLSDRDGLLRFDDDTLVDILKDVHLDVASLADLHGFTELTCEEVRPEPASHGGPPRPGDTQVVLQAVLAAPSLAPKLYELGSIKRDGRCECVESRKDLQEGRELHALLPGLSIARLDSSLNRSAIKAWGRFLRGTWLEGAVADFVCRAAPEIPATTNRQRTTRNVVAKLPGGKTFQLDVAHVWGPRLYGISCTTGGAEKQRGELAITKGKVFEVVVRSRQLGGDLARSAVVSLHNDMERDQLRHEMPEEWVGDQHLPEIFGISDIREWQGGNLRSLQRWLRS
ncbi:MAG: hypothetical protein ACRDJG_05825 [Actinomycetota bacterium]